MSTSTHQPTFLAVEERDGHPTLGGRRQFLDEFDAEVAEELRLFALEPVEIVDIVPIAASRHVRLVDVPPLTEPIDEVA
ncbi:hypothetical protein ACTJI8_12985 [Microbacterium sp. 22303]|uniref:hypothetical protein n=1 Tax=Microbacterium sp. 22303 TaxID=3453905 RepID=UPI003F82D84C